MNCDPNNLSKLSSCIRCLTDAQLMTVRTFLLCNWLNRLSAGTPNAPTNLDITAPSTAANITVTWTNPSPMGATNQLWRSPDGVTFALLATVSGGTSQFLDNAPGLGAGQFYYYKVRSCNGTNCSAFSSVISCCTTYVSPNVAAISFPTLIRAFGLPTSFQADGLAALTSISLPALKRTDGNLDLANNPNLTSITLTALQIVGSALFLATNKITGAFSLPALTNVFGDLQIQTNTLMTSFSAPLLSSIPNIGQFAGCTAMTSVNLNSLQTVGNFLLFDGDSALTSLSLPALVSVGNDFTFPNCTSLTSVSLPSLTTLDPQNFDAINGSGCTLLASVSIPVLATVTDGFTTTFNGCALNAASVNQVLARGVVWNVVGSDFELGAGTNAAPSGQGVADKATLIGRGNTVNTN